MNTKETVHLMKNNWTSTATADKDITMVSLFEYLGHAAGGKLGKEVYKEAAKQKIQVGERKISNPKYEGKVLLYPKAFLDSYFKQPETNQKEEYKLPF